MESTTYADSADRQKSVRTAINNRKPMKIAHDSQIEATRIIAPVVFSQGLVVSASHLHTLGST